MDALRQRLMVAFRRGDTNELTQLLIVLLQLSSPNNQPAEADSESVLGQQSVKYGKYTA
jgi:hypothetical protein